jgi:hypothetical protein
MPENFMQRLGGGLQEIGMAFQDPVRVRDQEQRAKLLDAQTKYYNQQAGASIGEERRMAMLQDAFQLNQMLEGGYIPQAEMLLADRLKQIKDLGGDPTHTLQAMQMLQAGDIDGLKASTRAIVDAGAAAKLLKIPGAEGADAAKYSPKSQIFEDGTVQMVNSAGEVLVRDRSGKILRGADAQTELEAATRRSAELQGLRSGERAASSQAIEQSGKYFERLQGVGNSVRLLEAGIQAIDEGANTGPIMSRLPSVSDASLALDQVQKEMGLNVLQNTTFGALSKDELKFALDTALPQSMNSKELRQWMTRKLEAQRKLEAYLYRATVFLNQPGNTIGKFLQRQEQMQNKSSFTWSELMESGATP